MHATVEQTGKHTFFGRTATLLQGVDSLGSLQRVLMRVVTVLLVCSRTHAPLLLLLGSGFRVSQDSGLRG